MANGRWAGTITDSWGDRFDRWKGKAITAVVFIGAGVLFVGNTLSDCGVFAANDSVSCAKAVKKITERDADRYPGMSKQELNAVGWTGCMLDKDYTCVPEDDIPARSCREPGQPGIAYNPFIEGGP